MQIVYFIGPTTIQNIIEFTAVKIGLVKLFQNISRVRFLSNFAGV